MKAVIFGGVAAALLAGNCFAQGMLETQSGAASSSATQSKYSSPGPSTAPGPRLPDGAAPPTSSKVFFDSLPQGARVEIQNTRRGCVTPCSLTVPYNVKFSVVFTKRGYQYKQMEIAPPMTDQSKASVVAGAIVGGLGGLIGTALAAKYQYTFEPFVAVLSLDSTGTGAAPPPRQANAETATHLQDAPSRRDASAPVAPARATQARISCGPTGCVEVKPGCRVVEQQNVSSSSAGGGGGAFVVCR